MSSETVANIITINLCHFWSTFCPKERERESDTRMIYGYVSQSIIILRTWGVDMRKLKVQIPTRSRFIFRSRKAYENGLTTA